MERALGNCLSSTIGIIEMGSAWGIGPILSENIDLLFPRRSIVFLRLLRHVVVGGWVFASIVVPHTENEVVTRYLISFCPSMFGVGRSSSSD